MTQISQSPPLDPRVAAVVRGVSPIRLQPYLSAAGGTVRAGVRLYQWNIDLSGAMYESLHVFEVFLRNAMDSQLCRWNAGQRDRSTGAGHSADWLMDPAPLLIRLAGRDIREATSRARRAVRSGQPQGRPAIHADVLAQLSLGTWRYLLPDKDPGRQRLWSDALSYAFPHLNGTSQDLTRQVAGVHQIRNRVAHLEPLLRSGMARRELNAMRAVLAAIDPLAEQWFTSRQRVATVLRTRR